MCNSTQAMLMVFFGFKGTVTERRGRVVNTHASYSGGPGFKSRAVDRLSSLSFSWFSSVPPVEFRDNISKLIHDPFLPNPSQFIVHLSRYHSTRHNHSYGSDVFK
jgi:hypothetical protein